jgi:hypothetical protein
MKNKTRDEDDANQSLFSAAGVRPSHPFSKTTHFADISNGVVANAHRTLRRLNGHNRVAVENVFWKLTQGSSSLATLGFEPESRWDSKSAGSQKKKCRHSYHTTSHGERN